VKYFDYEDAAREAKIPPDKLDRLCRRVQQEFPHDQMMYELHVLRACMAIKNGILTIDQALAPSPTES
jgi:hypothetical protein